MLQVLLDANGGAVLADFGISKTIENTCVGFNRTKLAGTPAYMCASHHPDELSQRMPQVPSAPQITQSTFWRKSQESMSIFPLTKARDRRPFLPLARMISWKLVAMLVLLTSMSVPE